MNPDRSSKQVYLENEDGEGGEVEYVHFILNQRTIPLGRSLKGCGERDDGWCEMGAFVKEMERQIELADYEYACFGEYEDVRYGDVTDGRPPAKRKEEEEEVEEL